MIGMKNMYAMTTKKVRLFQNILSLKIKIKKFSN